MRRTHHALRPTQSPPEPSQRNPPPNGCHRHRTSHPLITINSAQRIAIEQGIWKIGDKPENFKPVGMADESLLEDQVMHDIAILNADWLLIGRQVRADLPKCMTLCDHLLESLLAEALAAVTHKRSTA